MSGANPLDATTATISRNAILFDGQTLEQRARLLHVDCELLGRLLQLPAEPVANQLTVSRVHPVEHPNQ